MDTKTTVLFSAIFLLVSGAVVGVLPHSEEGKEVAEDQQEAQLDQPIYTRPSPGASGGAVAPAEQRPDHHQRHHQQQPQLHHRPLHTPHHQAVQAAAAARRHYPRYDVHQSYEPDTRIASNGVSGQGWRAPVHDARAVQIPVYGHATPVFYHPAPFPLRQYTTKVFRTHRRGSAVIPYEGASVRVPATWGQRKAHSGTIRTSVWPAGTFSTYSRHYDPSQQQQHHHNSNNHHQRPPPPSSSSSHHNGDRAPAVVTKRIGGRRPHIDNEVDTSSSEGISDESFCIRCPRKKVSLVAARGETKAVLKLPENFRRCPGRKALRGKKARRQIVNRHGGRSRGLQGDEHRGSSSNLVEDDGDNVRLEVLWGPHLGTLAQEGRHMTVFTLIHNNRALETCHVTMVVKVQRCKPLLLPPNTRARCSQETAWGSRCEFQCISKNSKSTYIPADVKETTCEMMNVNGLMGWSHEPPECLEDPSPLPEEAAETNSDITEEETCAMPFAPSDGTISCDDEEDSTERETVPVGTVCQYKCSEGFQIPPIQRHLATTKCLRGGDWSTAADPYCEKIVEDVQETMLPKSSITSRSGRVGN
ncbi:uncharacterized protein LOC124158495 [Ischnura elegans]|uniref:uncharacterized protein LOC124158495 n=1 Tax=Ischnura elegans TaxID=197161 RepID=UPI001ED87693|nr:uncharacterized protein LOC124158495 [Ischnura elegans]